MKTIIIVVVLTLVGLIGFSFVSSSYEASNDAMSSVVNEKNTASYTISGAVNRPGTYILPTDSTMDDLIIAAAGATVNADYLSYDVTFTLRPADKSYYIAPIYDNEDTCAKDPIVKCDINSADIDTLHEVAGLSNALCQAVVSFRATTVFQALEMVKDVPGIGQATYLAIRNKITLRSPGA